MSRTKIAQWLPKVLAACAMVHFWLHFAQDRCAIAENQPATNSFFLHDGDRVVFYGDSITEQRSYTTAIETFVATVCPSLKVSFINSGWAGDRAWGGEGGTLEVRLHRDVIAHRPTVVTVMLGMNDPYYMSYDPKILQAFEDNLETIVKTLQKELPGVRITLLGTSPYDDISPGSQPKWEEAIDGGYNAVVRHFSDASKEVATRHNLLFVDMNQPLVDLLKQAHEIDHDLAARLIPDRIHPAPAAGLVMAAQLLRAWNAPHSASTLHIDASTGKVVSITGTTVTNSTLVDGPRWTQLDSALPFPMDRNDPLVALTLRCSPQFLGLVEQRVRVTNLPNEKMSLVINGESVGVFTRADWAEGVAISTLPTPMNRQGKEVEKLVQLRNQLYFTRWRQSIAPSGKGSGSIPSKAADELARVEQELFTLQGTVARPTPKRFELVAP